MTKINFDMNALQRTVIPSLDKSIDSLNVLINKCSQLYVPYDFKYKTYLSNFFEGNIRIKKSVINIKDWIYLSDKKYNEIIEWMTQSSKNLNNTEIGRRYGAVK